MCKEVTAYVDGSIFPGERVGGYGIVLYEDGEQRILSGKKHANDPETIEILAIIEAIKTVSKTAKLTVFTDQALVVDTYNELVFNGFVLKHSKGNYSKWKLLEKLLKNRNVTLLWIKSKSGNQDHNLAHMLARGALKRPEKTKVAVVA